ncbi:MAG TPA: extracellular solute-binding protein [Limnochordia bacterium]
MKGWTSLHLTPILVAALTFSPTALAGEITWYTWPWSADAEEEWREELAAFEAQTGIHVNVINMILDRGGYEQQLLTLLAGGIVPDVIEVRGHREFPMLGTMGLLRDLTPLMGRSSLPLRDYAPPLLEGMRWQGRQLALPTAAGGRLTFLNIDAFRDAGIDPPGNEWRWDDLLDWARKMTIDRNGDGQIDRWGFSAPDYAWDEMVLAADFPAHNPDRTFAWNRPEVIEMVQFWIDLRLRHNVVGGENFLAGDSAIFMGGTWDFAAIQSSPPSFDWDIATYPRWRNRPQRTALIIDGRAILRDAPNPSDAWRFIEYLESRERYQEQFQAGNFPTGLVPDRLKMIQNLSVLGDLAPSIPRVYTWMLENGYQPARVSWYIGDQNWWDISRETIDRALTGEMAVPSAFAEAERRYNAVLAAGGTW